MFAIMARKHEPKISKVREHQNFHLRALQPKALVNMRGQVEYLSPVTHCKYLTMTINVLMERKYPQCHLTFLTTM